MRVNGKNSNATNKVYKEKRITVVNRVSSGSSSIGTNNGVETEEESFTNTDNSLLDDSIVLVHKTKSTDFKHVLLTICISLLAWPTCYYMNYMFTQIEQKERPFWMMISGFLVLSTVIFLVHFLNKVHDWLFYGFTLFAFTAIIDLIITLECYQIIHGYMEEYLKFGETYLLSSWGSAIALYDALGFFPMYLIMNFQLANGISWRSTSIYWASGFLNSMLVFGLGIVCGSHSPTACIFLNVPYIIFPSLVLIRAFQRQKRTPWIETIKSTSLSRIFDLFSFAILLISIWVTFCKGLASLNCQGSAVKYMVQHEKALHLQEPGPFAEDQAIVFLFYLLPLQCVSLFYHFKEQKPAFLWESTLIQAGAVLKGQFSYLVYSTDAQTPEEFRVNYENKFFWIPNLAVLLAPQFLLMQLYRHKPKREEIKIMNGSYTRKSE